MRAQRQSLRCLSREHPCNHPPTEACMIHSKQHRGCRTQDPGTRGYLRWKTAAFSHSARCAPRGAMMSGFEISGMIPTSCQTHFSPPQSQSVLPCRSRSANRTSTECCLEITPPTRLSNASWAVWVTSSPSQGFDETSTLPRPALQRGGGKTLRCCCSPGVWQCQWTSRHSRRSTKPLCWPHRCCVCQGGGGVKRLSEVANCTSQCTQWFGYAMVWAIRNKLFCIACSKPWGKSIYSGWQ